MAACLECGEHNPPSASFCHACGSALVARCDSCGAELPADARFCPACGRPVAAEQGEMLKLVTVLFADVVSSTAQAEAMHPEDTRALLGDFFAAMGAEIRAEGGAIEKFIGDAIMAVFGVPAAHEDDALRAVRAARRMLARLDAWNAERGADLQIRVGINSGDVLAGGGGGDLMVTGDAVNVAARLEREAPVGGILVGERTAQAVRRAFDLRELPALDLKGKSRPVRAWLVEREHDPGDAELALTAPMVGRDVELGLLQTLFERVRNNRSPQLVTIVGDAGIGKTRLVREFVASRADETDVVVGRCLPYGDGVTLWPLGEILKSRANVLETDAPELALAKIDELVRETVHPDLAPEPERTAAALASTIGLRRDDDPLAPLEPHEWQREFRTAWRALLAALAVHRPLVVVIEDIHWADTAMLAAIEDLASYVEGAVLFVTTARPEALHARPDWGGGLPNYSALPLSPLPSDAGARLLSHLLKDGDLPLAVAVLERAEGNPFFLEEIVRSLVESDRLHDAGEVDIPDTVQAVILARIDLLGSAEKRTLQQAAVIGRTFWSGAAARLTGGVDVEPLLKTLQRRGLVVERLASSVGGEVEYSFRHILIQEVAYESVPRRERARAHADAARWIEETTGARRYELAELLAHHYSAAHEILGDDDLRDRARAYCLIAARTAFARFAIEQAETFGRLAIDLSTPGAQRIEALEALGDLYSVTLRGDAAWQAYNDAILELAVTEPLDRQTLARIAAAAAITVARRLPTMHAPPTDLELRDVIARGLDAAGEADTRERALLLAAEVYAITNEADWDAGGTARAEEAAAAAVGVAERLGDADLLSSTLDAASFWLEERGLYGETYRANLRRVQLVPQLTSVVEVCDAHVVAAWSSAIIGRYGEAVEHASACIERARGVDAGQYVHALVWRAWAAFKLGDWDAALADHAAIDSHARFESKSEPPPFALLAYAVALLCHELRGDEEPTSALLELLLDRYRSDHGKSVNASLGMTAQTLIRRNDLTGAAALLERVSGRYRMLSFDAHCDLLVASGNWRRAREAASEMRADARHAELLALPHAADRLEAQALAATGEIAPAAPLLARARDGFRELGARWDAAYAQLLLGDALAVGGRAAEAEPELADALRTFEQLGSRREAERSRDVLAAVA